ncbi:YpzG family protein [Lederbergia graminis]|uniref:YpzG family protein n=1 Tax=Lederbergia graminis TaxID=735518 RepID=A0ABW0LNM5_9BACI
MSINRENSHLNKQLSPFNRGWFQPKHSSSQVNGQTEETQQDIVRRRDAVTRYRK